MSLQNCMGWLFALSTSKTNIPSLISHLKQSTDLHLTTSIHSALLKSGSSAATPTANHLINSYLRCHLIIQAQQVFDETPQPDVISWTSLMAGYVHANRPDQSLTLFKQMPGFGIAPNSFSVATAIDSCSRLVNVEASRSLHALVETLGLRCDLVVSTALVGLYGKLNDTDSARKVFDRMECRNVVSWGSMISAYAQNALGHDALLLYGDLLRVGELRPNHFVLSSAVNACASTGRLGAGKCTHAGVVRNGYEENDFIAGALIDMYAKCGCIEYSRKVFERIDRPSLVPYTAMIVAAAKYGFGKFALNVFDEMVGLGVKPNDITLVGVLHACSHCCGLVDIGLKHLDSMHRDHGIVPSVKHYTCAVDMLGRAGRLEEAYEIAKRLDAKGDDGLMLWSALLAASRTHQRLDVAAEAGKKLAGFDRDVAGAYVVMSNAYVSAGQWDGVMRVRSEMRRRGIRKEPGCSWVEIKDVAYVFYAGEVDNCPRGKEVLALLGELEVKMEKKGYVGRKKWGFNGMEEEGEEVGLMVVVHSEMLALGFALISVGKGVTVRVMKNLRMCGDCHEAFKMISDIVERDLVVRDLNRFHHFRDGSCTCGDYW